MIKTFLLICLVLLCKLSFSYGQCVDCYSLEEALKDTGRVKSLNLSGEQLMEVPSELTKFIHLEKLDLSNNYILELPPEISRLKQLKILNLSGNEGLGIFSFSSEFIQGSSLEVLDLSNCMLTMLNPEFGKFKYLKKINLANNRLFVLPPQLSNCTMLEDLNLENNQLQQSSGLFADYWRLKKVNIAGNKGLKLTQVIYSLLYKDSLQDLTLTPYQAEKLLEEPFNLLPIKRLEIKGGSLISFDGKIRRNQTLSAIEFNGSKIVNAKQVFGVLKDLQSLEKLIFKGTDVPEQVNDLNQIKELEISDALIATGCRIQKLETLQRLELNAVKIGESQLGNKSDIAVLNESVIKISESMQTNQLPVILEPIAEVKVIDSREATILKFDNTILDIPENAFLDNTGNLYKGEVQLKVKEIFDPVTMALAGSPMVVNEEGKSELMASNGMIDVRVVDNKGNELFPNPSAEIQVTIKDQQPENNSTLFAFNNSTNNWVTIGQPKVNSYDSLRIIILDSLNKLADDNFVQEIFVPTLFSFDSKKHRLDPSEIRFSKNVNVPPNDPNNKKIIMMNLPNTDQVHISKSTWKIDTVMNEDLSKVLREIKRSNAIKTTTKRRNRIVYNYIPRPVQELSIVPDFENDNFVMSMKFKGQKLNFPVYIASKENPDKTMKIQSKFYEEYQKRLKETNALKERLKRKNEDELKKMADAEREIRATLLTQRRLNINPNTLPFTDSKELLQFGLNKFGLINCDYFMREIPDNYYALKSSLTDGEDTIAIPEVVRMIIPSTNTYTAVYSSNIPEYKAKRTIVFFILGEGLLGLLHKKTNGQFIVEKFSIVGKSETEIRGFLMKEEP